MTLTTIPVSNRSPQLITQLVALWERSVLATHQFLTSAEVAAIRPEVPTGLRAIPTLLVARDATGAPVAFMGVAAGQLEMLFVDPVTRGQGIGRQLLQAGIADYGVTRLTVNEQNPQAVGFYQHLGFTTVHRDPLDDQGRPYPLLTMALAQD